MEEEVETNPDPQEGIPIFRLQFNGCNATGVPLPGRASGVPLPGGRFLVHAGAIGRDGKPELGTYAPLRERADRLRKGSQMELLEGIASIEGDRFVLTTDTVFPLEQLSPRTGVEWATWILGAGFRFGLYGGFYDDEELAYEWWTTDSGQTIGDWYRALENSGRTDEE